MKIKEGVNQSNRRSKRVMEGVNQNNRSKRVMEE